MNSKLRTMLAGAVAADRQVAKWAGTSAARFSSAIDIFINGPYRITQRITGPLLICIRANPAIIHPHLKKLIRLAGTKGTPDAVRRNTLRLLQFVNLPSRVEGIAMKVCMDLLQNNSEPVAVRVFAMTVLGNLACRHPDFARELRIIIERELPYATPGFISRGRKIIKSLP